MAVFDCMEQADQWALSGWAVGSGQWGKYFLNQREGEPRAGWGKSDLPPNQRLTAGSGKPLTTQLLTYLRLSFAFAFTAARITLRLRRGALLALLLWRSLRLLLRLRLRRIGHSFSLCLLLGRVAYSFALRLLWSFTLVPVLSTCLFPFLLLRLTDLILS